MEFRILGPVAVSVDGRDLELPAPKVRAVLAVLVVDRGQVVSADALVEALWGEAPPEGAGATLRSYLSQLRRPWGPR